MADNTFTDIRDYLNWLEDYNIILLEKKQLSRINHFVDLIWEWNKKINLTAAHSKKELVERHVLDSLILLSFKQLFNGIVVDLGSGGGFPAIPLAICNKNCKFYLIERVQRKSAFLNAVRRKLNLDNVSVLNMDLSEVQPFDERFLCISRAVRVDEKVFKQMSERGADRFLLHKSDKDEFSSLEYKLPGENKTRFIHLQELEK